MKRWLLALLLLWPLTAHAQFAAYNGVGYVTRSQSVAPYAPGSLVTSNTSGNAAALQVLISGTAVGSNSIVAGRLQSTGTDPSLAFATFNVYLYVNPPTLSGLADGSPYQGPYAGDVYGYVGQLTCSQVIATSDTPAQRYWPCVVGYIAGKLKFTGTYSKTTLYAVIATTSGYTPLAGETETVTLSTSPGY